MSQQDAEIFELDNGRTLKVLMLDPLTATDLLADIVGVIGPALAALSSGVGAKDRDALAEALGVDGDGAPLPEAANASIERAAVAFFGRFNKVQQRAMIDTLSKVTFLVTDDKEIQLSQSGALSIAFKGRISSLYRWLGFALKVQYADFFSAAGTALGPALKKILGK